MPAKKVIKTNAKSAKSSPKKPVKKTRAKKNLSSPLMVSNASTAKASTQTRSNKSASIERTNRFKNIDDGLIPFNYSTGGAYGKGGTNLDVKDAVILCQKAYYNVAIFRNTIDLMTELSMSEIFLTGGSKKSRDFFEAFFKKINLHCLQDKFFREYYRSGNVFLYKFEKNITKGEAKRMTQTFAAVNDVISLPIKYVILNPADVQLGGSVSFADGQYYKVLSPYEVQRLKNPQTDSDYELLETLPPNVRQQLKKGNFSHFITIPLESEKITAVFYKRQDYEPFAVPMGYPVLEDINWKMEMKKMDMALTRTMQQMILLVTMGAEPEKGGVNQKNLEAMQELFKNESIGRVLIADYTTKAEFVVPKIADLLDPKKYEEVNKDIFLGLNNVLLGQERFANQHAKLEVFIARLRIARKMFLQDFVIPEMKRISKLLGLRNYPTPHFEEIKLKDNTNIQRIYGRLIELGILTPEEGMESLESGRLPTHEESIDSQKSYKKLRDQGLYEPMVGGPETQKDITDKTHQGQMELQKENLRSQEKMNKEKMNNDLKKQSQQPKPAGNAPSKKPAIKKDSGRPSGTKSPQTTKKVSPIGASEDQYQFSKVKNNLASAQRLNSKVERELKKKHSLKSLNDEQVSVASQITDVIVSNEEPKDWSKSVKKYLDNPVDSNPDRVKEVQKIAYEHQVDYYLASMLYASKV